MLCTNITCEHSTGSFNAFGPDDSFRSYEASGSSPHMIMMLNAWLYLYGTKPAASIEQGVSVGANGSTVIMQQMNEPPGRLRIRCYLRSATGSTTALISHTSGPTSDPIPVGYYADCVVGKTGTLISYTTPAVFNESSPPSGSAGLMGAIDTELNARGLP